jgi:hypothetical protein
VNFSGSYRSGDVSFLLKPPGAAGFVDVAAKEALIQSAGATTAKCCRRKRRRRNATCACSTQACRANNERMARDCLSWRP